ncbi:hypothetical protein EYB53_018240 [Candidatus Chloroploca sp. M-50]|uniref:YfhO family protein n=1 Tax=Candidatus Chloroploca mongolica TaxID=2528176 RepID=A0ABS4DDY3_9CHLR|nr:hypothetical protein [Candidatus Chloroploca mongolica]MBP1467660.1 hypothetical protein [Candidatus Chloroploca mongolica]
MPKVVSALKLHLLVLGCYLVLSLFVLWPMPLHALTHVIATGPGQVDAYLGIWNVWWTAEALTTGQNPYVTPLLFHPQGLDIFWQTLSLPQGLLALPVTLTAGPLPAYNLLILLSFVLGGYFSFLLIRTALRLIFPDPAHLHLIAYAALVGGAVYTFAPFHMQKVLDAQLEVASIQWVPLWALATLKLLTRPTWFWALLSGLLLLWVGLGTWYYGLFALISAGVLAGLWALQPREPGSPSTAELRLPIKGWFLDLRLLAWGLVPILLWFVLMTPRLLHLIQEGDELLGDTRTEQHALADLISFWLANPNHPLWGEAVTAFYTSLHPGEILWNVAFGLVGIALALVGVAATWRTQWRWLVLGVLASAMALGPEIMLFGWHTGIPGPYALIEDLPGVRSSHRPNHFVVIAILTTALFAAAGTYHLLRRARRRGAQWMTAGLLVAVVLIDGWAGSLPLFQRPMPQAYLTMPPPDGTGGLLPIPVHLNVSNSEHLWSQTAHRWPIVGGFIGREPPYPLGRYAPGVRELRFGQVYRDDILTPGWPELARETLAAYTIHSVVFHHASMGTTLTFMRDLVDEMGLDPGVQDAELTFYPVPEPLVKRPLAYLGSGWGDLEEDRGTRWRWMEPTAQLFLLNPEATSRPVRLSLDLEAFAQVRPLTLQVGDAPPFTIDVARERSVRHLRLILPPGETVVYLNAPADSSPDQSGRQLSIAVMGIAIE